MPRFAVAVVAEMLLSANECPPDGSRTPARSGPSNGELSKALRQTDLRRLLARRLEAVIMSNAVPVMEFRSAWLPHVSDTGLGRIIDLLRTASPLLIHGAFTTAVPMGCLASHIGWNHPAATHRNDDAGIYWLTKVAGLNPATSRVVVAWDDAGPGDWRLRQDLLVACRDEADRRRVGDAAPFAGCLA